MSDRTEVLKEVKTQRNSTVIVSRNLRNGIVSASEYANGVHIRECRSNGVAFENIPKTDERPYYYYEDHLGSAVVTDGKYRLFIYNEVIGNFKINGKTVPKTNETIIHTLIQVKMKRHANDVRALTMFVDTSLSLTKYLEEFNDM